MGCGILNCSPAARRLSYNTLIYARVPSIKLGLCCPRFVLHFLLLTIFLKTYKKVNIHQKKNVKTYSPGCYSSYPQCPYLKYFSRKMSQTIKFKISQFMFVNKVLHNTFHYINIRIGTNLCEKYQN